MRITPSELADHHEPDVSQLRRSLASRTDSSWTEIIPFSRPSDGTGLDEAAGGDQRKKVSPRLFWIFALSQRTSMSTQPAERPAAASGTFDLGGDLTVNRLDYGAMQLTDPAV
ncbi:hypothetical protein [Streptomyces aurantiogriseus]|uniref:Uncharacterized protein n=1 Tax=Streptomyces aurantiogriseus TaxID=66870 RepID=A0A918FJA5_9ACTN|nr:hypothetical protein GCM10010251_67670 [Streptomyces aurantiogriseus]